MSMPIMQRILRGGQVRAARVDKGTQVHDGIKRSVYFDIQVAADIVSERAPGLDVADSGIGLLKLPYPDIFMEWNTLGMRWGCYVTESRKEDVAFATTLVSGSELYAYPVDMLVDTDTDGRFREWGFRWDEDVTPDGPDDEDQEYTRGLTANVIMALGLINCRNVETQETGKVTSRRSGAQKRRGERPNEIRYNTIVLPGGGTVSDGTGGHRATALHRVRGHFKTFTSERPLMGKHVGTYWWGWQVRGSSKYGTVVSDYELGE
ncbi:MAG: hypothetical protein JWR32_2994 [Mycobacterium sp.]|jgi:hypothetical protein|nr:hypothetical protein [Mycobacterium sp.]